MANDENPEIGSLEFAESLAQFGECSNRDWKYLGSGAFRMAFLGPDGVVYKQESWLRDKWYIGDGSNYSEFETFTFYKERGFKWIPKFHYFNCGIMAVQFLQDIVSYRVSPENRSIHLQITMHISDSYYNNCGLDETGKLFLRDGGNASNELRKIFDLKG